MRCSNCGNKIKGDSSFCTRCGTRVVPGTKNENPEKMTGVTAIKPGKQILVVGVLVLIGLVYFWGLKCGVGTCVWPHGISGEYCSDHTCAIDSCTNKRAEGRIFCYTHAPSSSPSYSYTPESATAVLDFSNISITHNSSYTVCKGTITNNGRKTYTFIEVKGAFKNASGTVVDTDWTYAVGSEGLNPGESATFRMSIDKDLSVKSCSVSLVDYDT